MKMNQEIRYATNQFNELQTAALCNGRPMEIKQENPMTETAKNHPQKVKNTCAKFNKAAKRKRKKQFQKKKMKKNLLSSTTLDSTILGPITLGSTSEEKKKDETEEADPSIASKLLNPNHNTPSSSVNHLDKMPKINDQSMPFVQAASSFHKVAIVPVNYPERKLSSIEAFVVKRLVTERIFSMSDDIRSPVFQSNWERDGAIVFNCANEETGEWLISLTSELKLENGVQLRPLSIDELPKCHRAIIHVEDPAITIKEVLYFLDKQNKGLAASDWVVIGESRDAKGTNFAMLISDRSLEALKALNFKPFCALSRAVVRLSQKRGTVSIDDWLQQPLY